ncbi:hypothetical protein WMF30_10625 [Sorangium sp. So ce134]
MAKACVDGGDETRVLLWASETDIRSTDRLSTEGAWSLAEHWSAVSLQRALLERQVTLLLQQHGAIAEVEQLDGARAWVRAIAAGETPEQVAGKIEATLRAIPPTSWTAVYGDDDARHAFERRRSEVTLRLAGALLMARTAERLSDDEVVAILTDVTAAWTNAMLSAWAARWDDRGDIG